MLTLRDFIRETLAQITGATTDFAFESRSTGANPNPYLDHRSYGESTGFLRGRFNEQTGVHATIVPIEFDVAVSVEETEAAKAGGGIRFRIPRLKARRAGKFRAKLFLTNR